MIIQKLSWAGVAVSEGDTTVLIDPIGSAEHIVNLDKPLVGRMGEPLEDLIPLETIPSAEAVLISHTHPDHFDPASLLRAFGSQVPILLPNESVGFAQKFGFQNVTGVSVGDSFIFGNLKAIATYSVDGYGTPQVSWLVESANGRILHCSDTLWHGFWWRIARQYGPIDVACLPINGAILEVPGLPQQSALHACMNPEEAVEAAKLLEAKMLVPIHYHTFHNPPFYRETPDPLNRTQTRANELSIDVKALMPGESLVLTR